jgi:valyl-tRNA synthetase
VETTAEVERCFDRFEVHAYPHALYEFFWSDYCDWFVEASKARMKDPATQVSVLAVQDLVLRQVLLLLQPIVPFIAEELWQNLGFAQPDSLLQDNRLPTATELREAVEARAGGLDAAARAEIEAVKELISRIRALKAEYNVASRRDVPFFFLSEGVESQVIDNHKETILNLAQVESLERTPGRPEGMPAGVTQLGTVFLDLAHSINVAAERQRLEKELAKLRKGIQAGEAKLGNEKFVHNAPQQVVQVARQQLEATCARFEEIQKLLQSLPRG